MKIKEILESAFYRKPANRTWRSQQERDDFKSNEMQHELGNETNEPMPRQRSSAEVDHELKRQRRTKILQQQQKHIADRIYIDIPFQKKDDYKAHGIRWDGEAKSWYYSGKYSPVKDNKGLPEELKDVSYNWSRTEDTKIYSAHKRQSRFGSDPRDKVYLNVPFKEKDDAKKAGARWDRDAKKWYFPNINDPEKLPKDLRKYRAK